MYKVLGMDWSNGDVETTSVEYARRGYSGRS